MDEVELEGRRNVLQGQYDILSQQDQDPRPPHIGDNTFEAKEPKTPGLRTSDSNLTLLPSKVRPVESCSKLPPKSFIQAPISKRIWKHILTATAAAVMVTMPVGIFILCNTDVGQGDTYCTITGSYALDYSYSYNDSLSSLFDVNIVFGSLTFGTAKFIDLAWDIGFSRCGQALLGWITYHVNAAALLRITETQPVSYSLFTSLSLSWSSIATLGPVTKAFFTKLRWRKKLLLLWIFLNILWVAFWPTITNAMTGYIAKNDTLVKVVNGTGYANFTDIATTTNLAFQFSGYNASANAANRTKVVIGPVLLSTGPNETLWNDLYKLWLPKKYTGENFTTYNTTPQDTYWTIPYAFYWYENESYTDLIFEDPASLQCVATGVYHWGFAYLTTEYFTILNGIWCCGTYALWIYVNWKSELCRKGRRLGQYRAAIDLVESINQDLGIDTCAYSEYELKAELKKKRGVRYYVEQGDGDAAAHIGITSGKETRPVSLRYGEPYGDMRERRL